MGKPIVTTPELALRAFAVLMNNVNLTKVNPITVGWIIQHPKEAGKSLTSFLANGCSMYSAESPAPTSGLPPNNAELINRGKEPWPGEAARLYKALFDILHNHGDHRTFWGFLPWVKTKKIYNFVFDWSATGYMCWSSPPPSGQS